MLIRLHHTYTDEQEELQLNLQSASEAPMLRRHVVLVFVENIGALAVVSLGGNIETTAATYLLLGILCLCIYVPGIAAIPVLDRDEARFAQATRQTLPLTMLPIRFMFRRPALAGFTGRSRSATPPPNPGMSRKAAPISTCCATTIS